MKRFLLLLITVLLFSINGFAQCTISGTAPNSSSYTCSSFSSCAIVYVGDGTNPTNMVMNANLDLTCLGAIQFVVRNNANIDFSNGNYDLNFAAGSSIIVETGGNISAGSNCSASDLIKIGGVKVASCNGQGGALEDFPTLVTNGGYNVVGASATSICGSGTSTITAIVNPAPTASTTYKFYTVASGGSPFYTYTASTSPYTGTYTTGTLSTTTTYYVEATTGSVTTARKAVVITVNALPAAPTVSLTQPTCSVATGTITITAPTGSGYTYSTNNSTYTNTTGVFASMASGTYSVTAKNSSGCISLVTSATINAQPATPGQPTLGSLAHPTCSSTNGTFTISNYNASYTYTASPSTGVSISGSTVTAPSGTYTVTATSGACSSVASASVTLNAQPTNTWNGTVWSSGSAPTSAQKIVFSGNYSSSSDVVGCSCHVSGGTVTINSGNTLTITNAVTVAGGGSLTFEDGASLVQINDAASNSGNITYKRKTTALKQYDYTYWSSPVASATLSQLATNSLFYYFSPTINNWVYQTGSATMSPGVGYIARAPSGTYSPTQIVQTSFVGTPNNGVITTPIVKSSGTYSLIGNPYPSAIDIDLFLTDASNTGVVNGTVYFWTHNTAITNNNYTVNDYAKYNFTGSVRTSTSAASGGALPTGKIAAGQGFFIEAKTSLGNGSYSATFRDAMRVSSNNSQFFKNNTSTNSTSVSEGLERHRVWLSLSSAQGSYNQMLVGYVQGATNDFDSLYDGKTLPAGNPVSIYTTVGTDNLSIQGRTLPFDARDVVPVGYTTTINGELTITLDNYDGLFDEQDVYLLDKFTGIYHDLKAGNFTFTTTSGTFNNRFELHYTTTALGIDTPTVVDKDIKVITNNRELTVLCAAASITKVEVFDILGKLLFTQNNLNTHELQTTTLNIAPQMILVKVTTDNGQTITKKTLIQ